MKTIAVWKKFSLTETACMIRLNHSHPPVITICARKRLKLVLFYVKMVLLVSFKLCQKRLWYVYHVDIICIDRIRFRVSHIRCCRQNLSLRLCLHIMVHCLSIFANLNGETVFKYYNPRVRTLTVYIEIECWSHPKSSRKTYSHTTRCNVWL